MNEIGYEERRETYGEALQRFGPEHQMNKFDEELGEFLTEWGRMRNGEGSIEKMAEEMADLTIMLEQLRMIFNVNEKVCEYMDQKILRLQKRLEGQ